ncbi:MAG: type II toxin-antitoxin system VapC family toxin [Halobacteria archaeon]
MTVLVDAGVLYADHDTDASNHDVAADALNSVYDGELGQPFLTDYIVDEVVTLTRSRTNSFTATKNLSDKILGRGNYPGVYEIKVVSRELFQRTVETFERYDDQPLSFTDASTIAVIDNLKLDGVLSFDDDFDGVANRFVPSEV